MLELKELAQELALCSSGVKEIRTLSVWRTLVVLANHTYPKTGYEVETWEKAF